MKTIKTFLTILSLVALYSSAISQGNCQGGNIKVYKGAIGCGCHCQKECVTPAELPNYLADGWNTVGCWNCCKFKNWVESSKSDVKIQVMDMAGRYVATVTGVYNEEQDNELILDQRELEPGMYLFQMETCAFNEVIKVSMVD